MAKHKLTFTDSTIAKQFEAGTFDWIEFDTDFKYPRLRAGNAYSLDGKDIARQRGDGLWYLVDSPNETAFSDFVFLPVPVKPWVKTDDLSVSTCEHPEECFDENDECGWCKEVLLTNEAYKERDEARREASDERAARRVQAKEFAVELVEAARQRGYSERKEEEAHVFQKIREIIEDM